jgi:hypothetical protein
MSTCMGPGWLAKKALQCALCFRLALCRAGGHSLKVMPRTSSVGRGHVSQSPESSCFLQCDFTHLMGVRTMQQRTDHSMARVWYVDGAELE